MDLSATRVAFDTHYLHIRLNHLQRFYLIPSIKNIYKYFYNPKMQMNF